MNNLEFAVRSLFSGLALLTFIGVFVWILPDAFRTKVNSLIKAMLTLIGLATLAAAIAAVMIFVWTFQVPPFR